MSNSLNAAPVKWKGKKKSGHFLFLATSRILKEISTRQAASEIAIHIYGKDIAIYTNDQGLKQWAPILQLCGVVEVNKSSWEENKKLHMINSGSRAWTVPLESHCHSSSVVIMWLILGKFINSWGEKKVYKRLKSFTSNSSWRTSCMVLRRNLLIVLFFSPFYLCIADNIIVKINGKCKASWHQYYICSTRDMFSKNYI